MDPDPRAVAARKAYLGARRWATWVMGLAFPVVLIELCWFPLVYAQGSLILAVLSAVAVCGGFWGLWVGCASLAGWSRGR